MEAKDQTASPEEVNVLNLLTDPDAFHAALELKGLLENGDALKITSTIAAEVQNQAPSLVSDFRTLLRDALAFLNIQKELRDKLLACCDATQDNSSETPTDEKVIPINDTARKLRAKALRDANDQRKNSKPDKAPHSRTENKLPRFPKSSTPQRRVATRNEGHTGKRSANG